MFDIPSIRVGKIFGIPFEINLSWIVIFALVAFTLTTSYYPSLAVSEGAPMWVLIAMGVTTSLLFFASILAHELSHAVVTRIEGGRVDKITLFLFGGVAQIEDEPRTPGRELLMASSGPLMSILLAGVCFLAFVLLRANGAPWWIWAQLQYLAVINAFVGVFNLLPGFPLDGGRVLRSILWAITGDILKATRWAARSGQAIGWTLVALAVAGTLSGVSGLIWIGLVGWFIAWLAGASYKQQEVKSLVSGVQVGEIMTPHPEYVDGAMTVETFVQSHLLGRQHSRYPVMFDGAIVGVVSLPDVKAIDKPDWPYVKLADAANRDLAQVSVDAATPVDLLLPRLAADKPGALLVVHEGRLAGIVTRADVIALLQRASQQ